MKKRFSGGSHCILHEPLDLFFCKDTFVGRNNKQTNVCLILVSGMLCLSPSLLSTKKTRAINDQSHTITNTHNRQILWGRILENTQVSFGWFVCLVLWFMVDQQRFLNFAFSKEGKKEIATKPSQTKKKKN